MRDELLSADNLSLRAVLDAVSRRKYVLIGFLVCSIAIGLFLSLRMPAVYRTSAQILVTGKNQRSGAYSAGNPISDVLPPDTGRSVDTQIQLLQSTALRDEANREAKTPPGKVEIRARQVKDTDVIELTAESGRAEYAERLLRALPDVYSRYLGSTRLDHLGRALAFSEQRLREENGRLASAEASLARFKRENGIANLDKERDGRINQAIELQSQIDTMVSEIVGLDAQLREVRATRRTLPESVVTPITTTNAAIQSLTDKIENLQTDRQRALILSKPSDLRIQELDAQIADLRRRMSAEPPTVTTDTRSPNPAIAAYDSRIDQLRADIIARRAALARLRSSQESNGIANLTSKESQLARLSRAVDLHRGSADLLANAVADLSIRVKAGQNPIHVITPAGSAQLVSPRHGMNLTVAILAGLFLGTCALLILEHLDDRVRSGHQAQHLLGSPVLGSVPVLQGTTNYPSRRILDSPAAMESYRMLGANLEVAIESGNIGTLLVSSAMPGEGKSLTACNLSAALASDSRSVILVDADVRRPCLHRYFGVDRVPGLSDVLSGRASMLEALHPTDVAGLTLLPAGSPLQPGTGHPSSRSIRNLLNALRSKADLVVCDGPPLLCAADAQMLASQTDAVVCVFSVNSTRTSALSHAASILHQSRSNVIGLVLNRADRGSLPYYDRDTFDPDLPPPHDRLALTAGPVIDLSPDIRVEPPVQGAPADDDEGMAVSSARRRVFTLAIACMGVLTGVGLLWPTSRAPAVTAAPLPTDIAASGPVHERAAAAGIGGAAAGMIAANGRDRPVRGKSDQIEPKSRREKD